MSPMDLDGLEPRGDCTPGRLCERAHHPLDFMERQFDWNGFVPGEGDRRRCHQLVRTGPGFAAAMTQLDAHGRAVPLADARQTAQSIDLSVIPKAQVVPAKRPLGSTAVASRMIKPVPPTARAP